MTLSRVIPGKPAERPIIFSGPMAKAILADRKTCTRRVVSPPVPADADGLELIPHDPKEVPGGKFCARLRPPSLPTGGMRWPDDPGLGWRKCPYGQPGDRLWVRETWFDDFERKPGEAHELNIDRYDNGEVEGIEYRATHDCASFEAGCPCNPDGDGKRSEWRPSIHMPRWASRIILEVTSVRVERLQDITEEDAKREGVTLDPMPAVINGKPGTVHPFQYREAFRFLWNAINGKRPGCSWADNCWVWVVSFKRASIGRAGT